MPPNRTCDNFAIVYCLYLSEDGRRCSFAKRQKNRHGEAILSDDNFYDATKRFYDFVKINEKKCPGLKKGSTVTIGDVTYMSTGYGVNYLPPAQTKSSLFNAIVVDLGQTVPYKVIPLKAFLELNKDDPVLPHPMYGLLGTRVRSMWTVKPFRNGGTVHPRVIASVNEEQESHAAMDNTLVGPVILGATFNKLDDDNKEVFVRLDYDIERTRLSGPNATIF